ncbi:diacylglycerol/lipid kinase family protein [Frateuria hangzhouensis]|uniref:diacylglycerol/lipid kinase family protein n=1 Tax=Frateuria hangzhouensis TaxID=2995589 RepID=UPI00226101A1|nr:diacylglycerol kinase family protein [Frateuria sp. STR12]MCX7513547.1 diacylglycerol kinase family protein [Frateuria sp. STR12]
MPHGHPRPFFVVLNRRSGSGDAAATEQAIRAALDAAAHPYRLFCARHPRELGELAGQAVAAAQARDGAVVVVGGDGTINAVVQAVLPAGLPLGALPQGTFNFFGRCHGLPEGDPGEGMHGLLDARETAVPVGMVNDRVFLVNASLGLYPELLERREQDKRRYGRHRLVALFSGLRALLGSYPDLRLSLREDGLEHVRRSTTLVVGANRLQLQHIGIPQADAVTRGALVGIVLPPLARWRMILAAVRGLSGHLGDVEKVDSFAFAELDVSLPRRRRIKLALDGEIQHLPLPLHFQVAPQPLRLLVPRARSDP